MPKFEIIGTTIDGSHIREKFDAVTPERALGECLRIYGELKRGYQIIELIDGYELPDYEKPEHKISYNNELDPEILRFYRRIKANVITQQEYDHFRKKLIGPIVKRAVKDLWNELDHIATRDEVEHELVEDVIREFLPRYKPEKGPLLKFLKVNIRNRAKKKWSRAVYVNADNPTKRRPRKEALKHLEFMESMKRNGADNIDIDLVKELDRLKILASSILMSDQKLPPKVRKALFTLIERSRIHRNLLKSHQQTKVFEQYYGKDPLKDKEIAKSEGLKQQTVNKTRRRAEQNILKQIL